MRRWGAFFGMMIWSSLVLFAPARADDAEDLQTIDNLIRANQFAEAVRDTKLLADKGQIESEFRLGLFYWHGVGIGQNYLESLHWVTLAALSGHEKAIAARKLILPSVDPANWPKTLDWARQKLQKTAEGGNNADLVALSRSYSVDFGFENVIEQYYWGSLSVAVGQTVLLKDRDLLSKRISVTDAAKVQDRVTVWLDKFRKEAAQ
jgi:hypothetical protein